VVSKSYITYPPDPLPLEREGGVKIREASPLYDSPEGRVIARGQFILFDMGRWRGQTK